MLSKRLLVPAFLFFTITGFSQKALVPVDAKSKVHFVIRNFGIKTGGDFSGLQGTIRFDMQNPPASLFDVTVNAATVDTDNDTRDRHLKKAEYFDVSRYPVLRMTSSRIQATKTAGTYVFTGSVTIKGTSKPISFRFKAVNKEGGILFSSEDIPLNRRTFDVGGNSISLSDDLKLSLEVFAK